MSAGQGVTEHRDDHLQTEHQVRVNKVWRWLNKVETRWQCAVLLLIISSFEEITYYLFDGKPIAKWSARTQKDPSQRATFAGLLEKIGACRQRMLDILQGLNRPGSDILFLLDSIGVREEVVRSSELIRFVRRLCLRLSLLCCAHLTQC